MRIEIPQGELLIETRASLTLIGGPTLLLDFGSFRALTDPTFDDPQHYEYTGVSLDKQEGPAIRSDALPPIDLVLLSHDQHMDNFDHEGRRVAASAGRIVSTGSAQNRLGGNSIGLGPWEAMDLDLGGERWKITATPARHGPNRIEPISGEVVGFVLQRPATRGLYLTGDTVWFPGVKEVAERFDVGLVVAFAGSAQPRGPFNVTMSSNDVVEAAEAFPNAKIAAIHARGWSHYRQSQEDVDLTLRKLGFNDRLVFLIPGSPVEVVY